MSDARPGAPPRCVDPDDPDYPRALLDLGARRPAVLHLRGVTPWPGGRRVARRA